MSRWHRPWLAVGLLILGGCASDGRYSTLQPMGGVDRKVDIGDVRSLRQMDRTPVQDAGLLNYAQTIRHRLEKAHGQPCDCTVLVDSFGGYEAYSLSSRTIVVSAGLVAQAGSEDEIAAVIAHELGHVYQGDTTKGALQQTALDVVKAGGWAAGAGGYTMMFGETVDDVAKGLIYHRFNEQQEVAADAFSAQLLIKAGYSLDGLKMAVRRLNAYGAGALQVRNSEPPPQCVTSKNGVYTFSLKKCGKQLSGSGASVYQSAPARLKPVMDYAASLPDEQRRRRPAGPPPSFASVSYLFGLNSLVSSDRKQLVAALAKVQAQPLPPTLAGNVAVTNKLAMAYNIAGDKQRAADNLSRSLQSNGRTAWTFNYLFKQVDRSGDSRQVQEAINASHEEIGYMTQLLPIEYYLAKRHKLQVYEMVAYGRCLSNLVDDVATYNTCAKFEKYAQNSGPARW